MRKHIYTVVCLLSFSWANSQDLFNLDSLTFSDWDASSEEWVKTDLYEYEYPSENQVIRKRFELDEFGAKFFRSENHSVFDNSGNLLERISYAFDTDLEELVLNSRRLNTFDAMDRIVLEEIFVWDSSMQIWQKDRRTDYEGYDGKNNYRVYRRWLNDGTNNWAFNFEQELTHFYDGEFLDSTYIELKNNENEEYFLDEKKLYNYDQGKLTLYKRFEFDSETNDPRLREEGIYSYDSEGREIQEFRKLFSSTGAQILHFEYLSAYSDLGIIEYLKRSESGGIWSNDFKVDYFRSMLSNTENNIPSGKKFSWINNVAGKLSLQFDEGLREGTRILIFNSFGQVIKMRETDSQTTEYNFNLLPGYYLIYIQGSNRAFSPQTVIIH